MLRWIAVTVFAFALVLPGVVSAQEETPVPTPTAEPSPTATAPYTSTVQLQFPPFDSSTESERGAAVARALTIVFVMVLIHFLYGFFASEGLIDNTQRIEEVLILCIFAAFQFVLLWMPERVDLQAGAFTLWLFLFMVRSALRGLATSVR